MSLSERFGPARLPAVEIVDMGREHRDNNWALLSRTLHRRIVETLEANRQVILLLNRRGFSTVLDLRELRSYVQMPELFGESHLP